MQKRSSKKSKDINVLAAHIVEQATGEPIPKNTTEESKKNPAAVALGRLGGLKGGGREIALLYPHSAIVGEDIAGKQVIKFVLADDYPLRYLL